MTKHDPVDAVPVETVVPTDGSDAMRVAGHSEDADPLARSNRLRKDSWALVVRRTWRDFFHDGFLDRAAAMTYFTLMAFAPTVLAAYSIATLLFASRKEEVLRVTSDFIDQYLPQTFEDQANSIVGSIIGSTAEGTLALVISVLISLFSASAYVRAFSRTANLVYGRMEGRSLIRTWSLMWGLTLVLVIGAVIVLFANLLRDTIVTGAIQPVAEQLGLQEAADFLISIFLPVWNWLRLPITLLVVLTLVAVLYHFAPNVRPERFRWLTLGSIVAVGVNGLVWFAFSLFVQYVASMSAYGAISTVMALFAAIWIMNTVLIVGIKVDAEILRAKELQLGLHSEQHIQATPRDDTAARAQLAAQEDLWARSEGIRDAAEADSPETSDES